MPLIVLKFVSYFDIVFEIDWSTFFWLILHQFFLTQFNIIL